MIHKNKKCLIFVTLLLNFSILAAENNNMKIYKMNDSYLELKASTLKNPVRSLWLNSDKKKELIWTYIIPNKT